MLAHLPFRAYIAFGKLDESEGYESLYLRLLSNLLPRRLKAFDRAVVDVIFEENSHIKRNKQIDLVESLYGDLAQIDDRRPLSSPGVMICSKKEECAFAIPDAVLGIFCQFYAPAEVKNLSRDRFERLRDKYRHIVNVDAGEFYSRRHPLDR